VANGGPVVKAVERRYSGAGFHFSKNGIGGGCPPRPGKNNKKPPKNGQRAETRGPFGGGAIGRKSTRGGNFFGNGGRIQFSAVGQWLRGRGGGTFNIGAGGGAWEKKRGAGIWPV